jgi:hypothetical protein
MSELTAVAPFDKKREDTQHASLPLGCTRAQPELREITSTLSPRPSLATTPAVVVGAERQLRVVLVTCSA